MLYFLKMFLRLKYLKKTPPYLLSSRLEMYCRDLTERFDDVWVVSGPLTLPVQHEEGKKSVTYQVRFC